MDTAPAPSRKSTQTLSRGPSARDAARNNGQGGKYKEKYTAMRERFDAVTARHDEIEKELAASEARARQIQEEMDLLLDALALAADTQPSLLHYLADDAPVTPAPPTPVHGYPQPQQRTDVPPAPGQAIWTPNGYHHLHPDAREAYPRGGSPPWPTPAVNGGGNGLVNGHPNGHGSGGGGGEDPRAYAASETAAYEYVNGRPGRE